jgi:hypothetical protein
LVPAQQLHLADVVALIASKDKQSRVIRRTPVTRTTLLDETYVSAPLLNFVLKHREWLFEHCRASGYRTPNFKDLVRMRTTGAFPGESHWSVWKRMRRFQEAAELFGSATPTWRTRLLRVFGLSVLTKP